MRGRELAAGAENPLLKCDAGMDPRTITFIKTMFYFIFSEGKEERIPCTPFWNPPW